MHDFPWSWSTVENPAEALQTNRTADISLAWQWQGKKTLMTNLWIPEDTPTTRENEGRDSNLGEASRINKTRKILGPGFMIWRPWPQRNSSGTWLSCAHGAHIARNCNEIKRCHWNIEAWFLGGTAAWHSILTNATHATVPLVSSVARSIWRICWSRESGLLQDVYAVSYCSPIVPCGKSVHKP